MLAIAAGVPPAEAQPAAARMSLLSPPAAGPWADDQGAAHPAPRETPEEWFWRRISPELSAADPIRWPEIVRRLERSALAGRTVANAPDKVFRILHRWGPEIRRLAARHHLSAPLIVALIAVESGGNQRAESRMGAQGLMQLMPETARSLGVRNPLDAEDNMRGGVAYIERLLRAHGEDVVLALAAYNSGAGNVRRAGGVPNFAETRRFIVKVADVFATARHFCAEPSAGARSGCELY